MYYSSWFGNKNKIVITLNITPENQIKNKEKILIDLSSKKKSFFKNNPSSIK